MSTLPSANSPASLYEKAQEAKNIDTLLCSIDVFSSQLHSLMAMLSGFRNHLYSSQEQPQSSYFYFPPHVNLEIANVLHKYNAQRLSEVMFKIQKEISKLLVDVKMFSNNDDFSNYDLFSILKNLEEGFGKVYHMQKIIEDVQERGLSQVEAMHE